MATFDQLSAKQRAIIELVLKRGQSYEQLGDMLDMPTARVKEHARSALLALAPLSADRVDEDWRGEIADYLLGQQSGKEATATRAHLRRSEAARAWSHSLLDSLEQFYDAATVPTIPSGDDDTAQRPPKGKPGPQAPAKEGQPAPSGLSP
ncbi:MAG: hypothetical protein LC713_02440, partial [Actinobacteria bacterium]|nr:hypothetical protein [Actinomycetota bacterium]